MSLSLSHRLLLVGLVASLVCACGGPRLPETPSPAGGMLDRCPPPLLRQDGEVRPVRVRLENATSDTLTVFLDRCFHHTRVATVAPGQWVQEPLPNQLVAFPEGLRFHGFDARGRTYVGTWVAPVRNEPILRLTLASAEAVPDSMLTHFALRAGQARVGNFAVSDDEEPGVGYAAVFARNTPAILSWACGEEGRRYLTLGTGGSLGGDRVPVRLRLDGGSWREEVWEVSSGLSDAAVAPEGDVERLTTDALRARRLEVILHPTAGAPQAHVFDLDGLEEALAGRPCFSGLVGSGGGD